MEIVSKEHFENIKMMSKYFKMNSEKNSLYEPEYIIANKIILIIETEKDTELGIKKIRQILYEMDNQNHKNDIHWYDFKLHVNKILQLNNR